jgi:uncharacterized membrane protein YgdD (TMEM256/DUF423 family)
MERLFLAAGALLAGLGVAAGAFGAHALEASVSPDRLQTFETAVRYQMYHALALLLLGVMPASGVELGALGTTAGVCFTGGVIIFSGSLYLLVLTDTPWLGAVTPLGGAAFLAGWAALLLAVIRSV